MSLMEMALRAVRHRQAKEEQVLLNVVRMVTIELSESWEQMPIVAGQAHEQRKGPSYRWMVPMAEKHRQALIIMFNSNVPGMEASSRDNRSITLHTAGRINESQLTKVRIFIDRVVVLMQNRTPITTS